MSADKHPYCVALGASGSEGLSDIIELLNVWPKGMHAVLMVVLHRLSEEPSNLRGVLASRCAGLHVEIAREGEVLIPDVCYIGMPDRPLTLLEDRSAFLIDGSNNRLRNRTVDALFHSMAENIGQRTVGIVLSGSLDDGSRGLAAIHEAGGLTMVLDPQNKPRGMQQNAIDFDGPITFVGSGTEIALVIGSLLPRQGNQGSLPIDQRRSEPG
ncbi:Protein-glutamate methylesterase/protein-glutamine glutaminase (plasmid) [Caballeronia sp. SBC1]|uniref:chemotaxis protein CheB n=1 Tax=unclassified Caballeronia TaxID=2646786 RepID=UPI0013E10FB9|nr:MULTISPECIES: chemotaxis protein CheB [unclassified Caballeronia]QIE29837.1 Protein-glutamate methylesterase/protein-glutamine glutaminase [Caballeronia sp. SBC2]QIN67548.1 Protein-glutamate methylesterase/protein-glutamine glutaminase [Caballeronia sp. SBC1]